MKKIILLLVLTMILFFGCTQKPLIKPLTFSNYTDGQLNFQYPNWQDSTTKMSNDTILVKTNVTCVFGVSKYPYPSSIIKPMLAKQMKSQFYGEYMQYNLQAGNNVLTAKTRAVYCDYQTYALTIACAGTLPTVDFLSSVSCAKRNLTTKPKLGLIANPSYDDFLRISPTIRDARTNGAEVLYRSMRWADMHSNWTFADYFLEPMKYEGKVAIDMVVIHTSVLGNYTPKYLSFNEPGFKDDFADFSAEFVSKYKPEYYFVGNEVDIYLSTHRNETAAFKAVLKLTCKKVNQVNPSTKCGFTATYHDSKKSNVTDIIKDLAEEAEIIAYTSYGYHDLFEFDNVSIGINYLNDIKNVVSGKPFVIVETGWSSSSLLKSNEDKQAQYAEAFFNYINSSDAEFVTWFTYHDGANCTEGAKSFLTHVPEITKNQSFMNVFTEYLCTLGLKKNDGTPKKAWNVWEKNT